MGGDDNAAVSELVHLTSADARRVLWKNGRGVTDELAIWPPGASFEKGDFDWRISKAAVVEAGPFSSFPEFERVLVVTAGDGLALSHGDAAPSAVVRALEPYAFDGAWTTAAELTQHAVRDFNVLTRRGRFRADVRVVRSSDTLRLLGGDAFVHVLEGDVAVRFADGTTALAAGESAWVRDACDGDAMELAARGDCVVLCTRITDV
jgi:environmental stress-induced protein Ves